MSYLMLKSGMNYDAVLDLTPKTIWYLFERDYELIAQGRLMLVDDMTAVAAPTQLKDGMQSRQEHVRALYRAAGYTLQQ